MFAVIKTGGKQYRVAANDVIEIERTGGEAGETVAFEQVLMLGGSSLIIGSPHVAGATVAGEIVELTRGPKVISFKKRRRKNSKRKRGHRQDLMTVRITEILTDGKKPSAKAKAAPAAKDPAAKKADEAPKAKAGAAVGIAAAGAVAAAAAKPAKAEAAPAAGERDENNISLISGIGPTIEKKLRAAGVNTWSQIAAWTDADIAKFDDELKLRGRATREEWIEQAKELLAGKPPRAKIDQAEQKSGEDW
jgi:large subunit ribosomal protein L21